MWNLVAFKAQSALRSPEAQQMVWNVVAFKAQSALWSPVIYIKLYTTSCTKFFIDSVRKPSTATLNPAVALDPCSCQNALPVL